MKHRGLIVRRGQIWKRKKDGVPIVINRGSGDEWKCYQLLNPKITHHITRYSLQKFWDLIEKEDGRNNQELVPDESLPIGGGI